MTTSYLTSAALYLGLVALVIVRQLSTRRIDRRVLILPLVLMVIGLNQATSYALHHAITAYDVVTLLLSLAISATLAVPRTRSMRVWWADGAWWSRGTVLTLVLWVLTMLVRFGVAAGAALLTGHHPDAGFVGATALLTAAVSLGVQGLLRMRRTVMAPAATI